VRRGAVLEQEDALPSAELQPSVGDGDAELGHTAAGLGAEARRQALPTKNSSPS